MTISKSQLAAAADARSAHDLPIRRSLRLNNRLPVVVVLLLLVNQLFNPARIWMGLLLGLAATLLIAYFWTRFLRDGLDGRRRVRGTWVIVGDLLTETFTVENRSGMPALGVEVVDWSDLPGYNPDWVATVSGTGSQSYEAEGRCQHRGVFTLGPWELRAGDPLGLFTAVIEIPQTRSILVYPRAMQLPDLQLPRGKDPGASRTSRQTQQFTTTVSTVRHYVPGDSLRRIHWRRTAHHDAFMVKEFDHEPSGDLWLVLDLFQPAHAGQGAQSTLEYGITLAASLATQMLSENRRVGLAAQGHLIQPQAGQLQVWRILEALAHAETSAEAPLARLLQDLRQNAGRGRTVVVITPSTDPAWPAELLHLARMGNAPAALLLDAASFAEGEAKMVAAESQELAQVAQLEETEVVVSGEALTGLQGLLAENGVPAHLIDSSFIFRPMYEIRRTRTELRTLSATGRVIKVEVEEIV
jgi:uncharacterized protein (DUF58 family)